MTVTLAVLNKDHMVRKVDPVCYFSFPHNDNHKPTPVETIQI